MSEVDYGRLREGLCPVHVAALERREDSGWCDACGHGWSLAGDLLSVHMEFCTSTLNTSRGELTSGPGGLRVTRKIDGGSR